MRNAFIIFALVSIFISCTKKEVGAVSFDVKTDSTIFKVNDTVNFRMSGNPDYIVFWSGEIGNDYNHRNRDTGTGMPILCFTSQEKYGNHKNTLHLMVSTDFKGKNYDTSELRNATWIDITRRAKLDSTTNLTPSGNINLGDFLSYNTPIYIAFQFADQKDGVNAQRSWNINNLSLINYLSLIDSSTILDIPNNIWLGVSLLNPAVNWKQSSSLLTIGGGTKDSSSNEAWIISQPINLRKVIPDAAVPVKKLSDPILKSFYHIYSKPGNYRVVFNAVNANANGKTEALKSINITVQ